MTLPFMTIGWFLVLISALVFWRMKVFSTRSSDMSSSGLVAPAASVGGNESVVNFQRALSTLRSFDRINREQGFGSRGAMQRLEMEKADHAEDKPDKGHVSVTLRKWTTTDSELAHRVAEALVSERQLQLPGENSSSIFPPCPSFEQGSHDAHPIDHPNSSWTDAQILAPFASELVAIGDVPMGMRTYNSRQEDTLLLQHPGEPLEMTRHMTSANSSAGPFPRSVSVESFGNWETWWRENTMEMAAILSIYTNFNVKDKMECVMLARSAKIYQRLVVYVYIQMKEFANVHGSRNSLRKALSEWEEWDDLQWLANHHVVRNTLWHMLSTRGVVYPKQVCDIRGILDFDTNVIQKMVMTILNDRKFKKRFLALCQNNPMPVANLFQTLLDQDNLQTKSRSLLARALARLAKSSKCYPDCLILTAIRRTGTDPVAGGGFSDVWKGYFAEETVAMKALRIYKQSVRECVLKEFSHEAVIWRQLRHPNILPFYGVFKGDALFDRLCLISPWMDAGNVNDYLGDHPDSDRLSLLSDVAQGLEYLHLFQPPIIHGDLKGANIFVSPSYTACLGDFGLARFRDSLESTLGATTGNTLGTLRWQAPELLNIGESVRQSEQCDIYSFGCVCLELMTGRPPFSETRNDAAVMMAIAKGQIPQRPLENALERGLDDTLWAWMQQCWNFDPALRPKVVQLVEHFKTHQRESRVATQTVSQLPRASLDQYGFPTHYVSAVSGLTAQENINNVEQV
ncbi:kinase-like protein [Rickenella mellea]|uniref:Kinase-like protein n=1 Tax=Rickenella mellea TaxID=50990 RepID=A0A4Y7QAH5_9AGAM|nr:kinase-like protein [Rickenella mellea]